MGCPERLAPWPWEVREPPTVLEIFGGMGQGVFRVFAGRTLDP